MRTPTDPLEIAMNDSELMKVGRARHDPRELKTVMGRKSGTGEELASGLTNCKRFTSGLDLVYSITFPFRIQSDTMRKLRGSVEMETPSNGKILGWERLFQAITSRQNRYV